MSRQRPTPEPSTVVFVLGGPIGRAVIPELCDRVRTLLTESSADLVVCDVGALVDLDAVTVETLARLQLTARRCGRQLRLRDASAELCDLLAFMGLGDVVRLAPALRVKPRGQTEGREQGRGVQEEGESADPTS